MNADNLGHPHVVDAVPTKKTPKAYQNGMPTWWEINRDPELSDTAIRVWLCIASHQGENASTWMSNEALAKVLGRSSAYVKRGLQELCLLGRVRVWFVPGTQHHSTQRHISMVTAKDFPETAEAYRETYDKRAKTRQRQSEGVKKARSPEGQKLRSELLTIADSEESEAQIQHSQKLRSDSLRSSDLSLRSSDSILSEAQIQTTNTSKNLSMNESMGTHTGEFRVGGCLPLTNDRSKMADSNTTAKPSGGGGAAKQFGITGKDSVQAKAAPHARANESKTQPPGSARPPSRFHPQTVRAITGAFERRFPGRRYGEQLLSVLEYEAVEGLTSERLGEWAEMIAGEAAKDGVVAPAGFALALVRSWFPQGRPNYLNSTDQAGWDAYVRFENSRYAANQFPF